MIESLLFRERWDTDYFSRIRHASVVDYKTFRSSDYATNTEVILIIHFLQQFGYL